jgi:hypothetical protein
MESLLGLWMLIEHIEAHRKVRCWEGGEIQYPPQANFKTLVYKNAIKPEIFPRKP